MVMGLDMRFCWGFWGEFVEDNLAGVWSAWGAERTESIGWITRRHWAFGSAVATHHCLNGAPAERVGFLMHGPFALVSKGLGG